MNPNSVFLLFCLCCVSFARLIPPPRAPPIQGVQGNDDQVMALYLLQNGLMDDLQLRYAAIQQNFAPGNRRYNLFWSEFESTEPASAPVPCPSGTVLVPLNEVAFPATIPRAARFFAHAFL
jgi:hypothetical protein